MKNQQGRVAIKKAVYRDREGFLIYGKGRRIFTVTYTSAERIRDKVKRNESTTIEDFER